MDMQGDPCGSIFSRYPHYEAFLQDKIDSNFQIVVMARTGASALAADPERVLAIMKEDMAEHEKKKAQQQTSKDIVP